MLNNKGWKVDLRRQFNKATPDIRISRNDQSLCILELKVGMSWIRSFICPTFYKKAKHKYSKDNKWDPDAFNQELCRVLNKYEKVYSVTKDQIYFVVPSLVSIHYKRDSKNLSISDYRNHFSMVSGLAQNNLVIFNESLTQKLEKGTTPPFLPTRDLENMITKILKL